MKNNNKQAIYQEVGSFIWEIAKTVLLAVVIVSVVKMFLLQPFKVVGASMLPNFWSEDFLIASELGYKSDFYFFSLSAWREIERGDVVVFRPTRNRNPYYIKRVIGLPGEKVIVGDNKIVIYNNEYPEGLKLDEDQYLEEGLMTCVNNNTYQCEKKEYQLKDKEYFLMGDNRENSSDSRVFGPFPESRIIGKVILRIWPLNRFKIL